MCRNARPAAGPAGYPRLPREGETPLRQGLPVGFWGAACVPRGFATAAVPLSPVPERVRVLPRGSQGGGSSLHPSAACGACLCCWKEGLDPPIFTAGGAESGNPGWPGRILAESFRGAE